MDIQPLSSAHVSDSQWSFYLILQGSSYCVYHDTGVAVYLHCIVSALHPAIFHLCKLHVLVKS